MYDAIIVGARCAGSPLAMLLAKQGHRVLVVDRDTFPSDTLSTALMLPDAVLAMHEWGLVDRLEEAGTPGMGIGAFVQGMELPRDELPISLYAPRRTVLDKILLDAAREAGAEVREGFSVRELLRDQDGAVTGVRGLHGGQEVTEEARVVIGADGRNSFVARTVGAPEYDVREGGACGFYSFFDDVAAASSEVHFGTDHVFFFFPTNGNQTCVAMEAPKRHWEEFRADPDAYFAKVVPGQAPAAAERFAAGKRAERWYGMGARNAFYRKPYGRGWALVGDAGFLKDPILGSGINDAFRDARLLAQALHAGIAGAKPLDEELAAYEETRNRVSKPGYDLTCDLGEMKGFTMELLTRIGELRATEAQSFASR
jgi:2-polyprenyl-6-methoxyphenol hydroxylase-like FAD-dependent oxidoreductase